MTKNSYIGYSKSLLAHYENFFGIKGKKLVLNSGPTNKVDKEFRVLLFHPNKIHKFYIYCTLGMSINRTDDNLIELFVFSPKKDKKLIELLTYCASFHRNDAPLNLYHTVNIGQPWIDKSICDHGYISLPYMVGKNLEIFSFEDKVIHCYWFIPITKGEREFKIENGSEELELLFERSQFNYLDPKRIDLVNN